MAKNTRSHGSAEDDHQQFAQQLLAQENAEGVELVGPNGLLNQLTANVLETALDAEMDKHLGYEKPQVAEKGRDLPQRATNESGTDGDRPRSRSTTRVTPSPRNRDSMILPTVGVPPCTQCLGSVGESAVEGLDQVGGVGVPPACGGEVADFVPGVDRGDPEPDQGVWLSRAGWSDDHQIRLCSNPFQAGQVVEFFG